MASQQEPAPKHGPLWPSALLAVVAGALAGVSVASMAGPVNQWWSGGGFSGRMYSLLALAAAGGLVLLTRFRPARLHWQIFATVGLGVALVLLGMQSGRAPWQDTKERAYSANMRSDLRNLVRAQQEFFADSGRYAEVPPMGYFVPASGTVGPFLTLTSDGWTAEIWHEVSRRACVVYVGTTPRPPATLPEQPVCTRGPFPIAAVLPYLGLVMVAFGLAWLAGRISGREFRPA